LDGLALIKTVFPAFAPSAEFGKIPVLKTLLNATDAIYMPRGGTEEARAKAIQAIRERQLDIEETGELNAFLIFPEGTTSNGKQVMPFKQGAFLTEKTITPILLKYSDGLVSTAYDIIDLGPLLIMMCCWGFYSCEVKVLPDFQPNCYIFERHADKAEQRW